MPVKALSKLVKGGESMSKRTLIKMLVISVVMHIINFYLLVYLTVIR